MERRRATGWHAADADEDEVLWRVQLWEEHVHTPGIYDLEVDTSVLRAEECAAQIRQRIEDGSPPSAFRRLAALAEAGR